MLIIKKNYPNTPYLENRPVQTVEGEESTWHEWVKPIYKCLYTPKKTPLLLLARYLALNSNAALNCKFVLISGSQSTFSHDDANFYLRNSS